MQEKTLPALRWPCPRCGGGITPDQGRFLRVERKASFTTLRWSHLSCAASAWPDEVAASLAARDDGRFVHLWLQAQGVSLPRTPAAPRRRTITTAARPRSHRFEWGLTGPGYDEVERAARRVEWSADPDQALEQLLDLDEHIQTEHGPESPAAAASLFHLAMYFGEAKQGGARGREGARLFWQLLGLEALAFGAHDENLTGTLHSLAGRLSRQGDEVPAGLTTAACLAYLSLCRFARRPMGPRLLQAARIADSAPIATDPRRGTPASLSWFAAAAEHEKAGPARWSTRVERAVKLHRSMQPHRAMSEVQELLDTIPRDGSSRAFRHDLHATLALLQNQQSDFRAAQKSAEAALDAAAMGKWSVPHLAEAELLLALAHLDETDLVISMLGRARSGWGHALQRALTSSGNVALLRSIAAHPQCRGRWRGDLYGAAVALLDGDTAQACASDARERMLADVIARRESRDQTDVARQVLEVGLLVGQVWAPAWSPGGSLPAPGPLDVVGAGVDLRGGWATIWREAQELAQGHELPYRWGRPRTDEEDAAIVDLVLAALSGDAPLEATQVPHLIKRVAHTEAAGRGAFIDQLCLAVEDRSTSAEMGAAVVRAISELPFAQVADRLSAWLAATGPSRDAALLSLARHPTHPRSRTIAAGAPPSPITDWLQIEAEPAQAALEAKLWSETALDDDDPLSTFLTRARARDLSASVVRAASAIDPAALAVALRHQASVVAQLRRSGGRDWTPPERAVLGAHLSAWLRLVAAEPLLSSWPADSGLALAAEVLEADESFALARLFITAPGVEERRASAWVCARLAAAGHEGAQGALLKHLAGDSKQQHWALDGLTQDSFPGAAEALHHGPPASLGDEDARRWSVALALAESVGTSAQPELLVSADTDTLRFEPRHQGDQDPVQAIRFGPAGTGVVVGTAQTTLLRVKGRAWSSVGTIPEGADFAELASLSPDGRWLALGREQAEAKLYRIQGDRAELVEDGFGAMMLYQLVALDGGAVASIGFDQQVPDNVELLGAGEDPVGFFERLHRIGPRTVFAAGMTEIREIDIDQEGPGRSFAVTGVEWLDAAATDEHVYGLGGVMAGARRVVRVVAFARQGEGSPLSTPLPWPRSASRIVSRGDAPWVAVAGTDGVAVFRGGERRLGVSAKVVDASIWKDLLIVRTATRLELFDLEQARAVGAAALPAHTTAMWCGLVEGTPSVLVGDESGSVFALSLP